MDLSQASLAQARRNKRIPLCLLATQADLASDLMAFFLLLSLLFGGFGVENPVGIIEMVGVSNSERLLVVLHLYNHVLDSAHFDYISRF